MIMNRTVYIIALHEEGRFTQETFEAVSFARDLGEGRPRIIVPAGKDQAEPLACELARKTGLDVTGLAGDSLRHYSSETYAKHLSSFLKDAGPALVCIPHTSRGSDFAPQLSVRLGSCCITAIEGIRDGVFVRSLFGGKYQAYHRISTPSAVLSVMPGAWRCREDDVVAPGAATVVHVRDDAPSETAYHGISESAHTNMALTAAEVVVSAGRGVGKAEHIGHIRALASLFPKSAIGSSRAVCDLGWLDYSHQIGSTGNKVSPRLYVACGISGALQHIAGMKDSRMVIAINTDPHAAIFSFARYCIVEDLTTFIPLVMALHEQGG
jgi:electron transfer flavoprotein alpha subunit